MEGGDGPESTARRRRDWRDRRRPAPSGPPRPPADLGPPFPHPWLSTDDPRRARRAFVHTVVFAGLDADDLACRADLYADRWGTLELVAALRAAHRRAPLPAAAARLLAAYTTAEVAA